MNKLIFIGIIYLCFSGCTTTFNNYSLRNIQYPDWINTEYPKWMNEDKKNTVEYNHNNILVLDWRISGANHNELRLLINPKNNWNSLYIQEISFMKDGEKIYFVQNKNLENDRRMFTHLVDIKFKYLSQYFKNMELNDVVEVQLMQIYKFDEDQLIIEMAPYKIICFEDTYNPLNKFNWGY